MPLDLRLRPVNNGDGTVPALENDGTGSSVLGLLDIDLQHLEAPSLRWLAVDANIRTADAGMQRLPQLLAYVQMVDEDHKPWSEWMDEVGLSEVLTRDL